MQVRFAAACRELNQGIGSGSSARRRLEWEYLFAVRIQANRLAHGGGRIYTLTATASVDDSRVRADKAKRREHNQDQYEHNGPKKESLSC